MEARDAEVRAHNDLAARGDLDGGIAKFAAKTLNTRKDAPEGTPEPKKS